MSRPPVFYVAHVFTERPDGALLVSRTSGGHRSAEVALRAAQEHATPGQHYQVRKVTIRAWDVWSLSGCGHTLPVQGEVIYQGTAQKACA